MVDKKIVEYVANLARIEIDVAQKDYLAGQLSKIFGYIDKLKEVNVDNVEPMRGLHLENNILRSDVAIPSNSKEDILKNSPSREGNYFKVPPVIE